MSQSTASQAMTAAIALAGELGLAPPARCAAARAQVEGDDRAAVAAALDVPPALLVALARVAVARARKAEPPERLQDRELAQRALQRGLLNAETLAELEAERRAQSQSGEAPHRLAQQLIRRGLIDTRQLAELLRTGADDVTRPAAVGGAEVTAGQTLGKYELVREIARGGMGVVFEAVDPSLKRIVALKLLRDGAGESEHVERLRREGALAAQLSHPGIITVHEVGEGQHDGRPVHYIAMDLIEGPTLDEVAPKQPLAERVRLLTEIADAVGHAHAHQVVHRDLKPANVLVDRRGRPIVTDFGLARDEADSVRLTQSHAVMGTAAYMSPEQVLGAIDEVDARSDVWALGVMLYELLTDRLPFVAESAAALYRQITDDEPLPPRRLRAGIASELETICLKALERTPAYRYPDAAALAQDLRRFARGRPIAARPPTAIYRARKWVGRHRALVTGALIVVLASVGTLIGARWRQLRRIPGLLETARQAATAGRPAAAREAYGAVLAIDAEHAEAREGRDEARLAERERTRAEDRGRQAAASLARARALLKDAAQAEVSLSRGWRDRHRPDGGLRPEPLADRALRRSLLERHLEAASLLDAALALAPEHGDALALRRAAGMGLGQLALIGGDLSLARRAFADLARFGAPPKTVATALARVDRERTRLTDHRRTRLTAITGDLARGLGRPGRAPGADTLDDMVLEAAGYRDQATVTRLTETLAPLIERARAQPPGRGVIWTPAERDTIRFCLRVLPLLQIDEALRPLVAWVEVVRDAALAVEGGHALCRTRRAEARAPLIALRDRFGMSSSAWKQILPLMPRVPAPAEDPAPTTARAFVARGLRRFDAGEVEAAAADFGRAIALAPDDAEAYFHRATALGRLGRPKPALVDIEKTLALRPGAPSALLVRGNLRRETGDLDGAVADLTLAVRGRPDDPEVYTSRGIAYAKQGALQRARADFDRALEVDPRYDKAYVNRGLLRERLKDLAGALRDYDRAVALEATNAGYLVRRAVGRRRARQHVGAKRDLERALVLDPRLAEAYLERSAHRMREGDTAGAVADSRTAVELDPDDWRCLFAHGTGLFRMGRREEGVAYFRKARQHAPPDMHRQLDQLLGRFK